MNATSSRAPKTPIPVIESIASLASGYEVLLSDIWGVVHNGREHFAAACSALRQFRDNGGTVILITNAPRPFPPVLEQLKGLGVPDGTFDAVVTSGDVTLAHIAARGLAPLYHIGPPRDLALFDILKEQTGLNPPRVDLKHADYVVCTGLFDDDHSPADYQADFDIMAERGLTMISANPDIVVHVGDRELYCSGALAEVYEKMGGAVIQAGKPFAPIYDRALELAQHHHGAPLAPAGVLTIGDGMRTDIAGAMGRGLDAVFITSGIHKAQLHPPGPDGAPGGLRKDVLQSLAADAGLSPLAAMERLAW